MCAWMRVSVRVMLLYLFENNWEIINKKRRRRYVELVGGWGLNPSEKDEWVRQLGWCLQPNISGKMPNWWQPNHHIEPWWVQLSCFWSIPKHLPAVKRSWTSMVSPWCWGNIEMRTRNPITQLIFQFRIQLVIQLIDRMTSLPLGLKDLNHLLTNSWQDRCLHGWLLCC